MRSLCAYLAILLYLTVMVRPVVPWLSYGLQRDYFAQALCQNKDKPAACCKGSCVLKRMVAETNRQENPSPASSGKVIEELPLSLIPETILRQPHRSQVLVHHAVETSMPGNPETSTVWHPPTRKA